jgi:hypothetical protein
MKWAKFTIHPLLLFVAANAGAKTDPALTRSNLPQFLAGYEQSLEPIDAAYADLMDQPGPMRNNSGKRVGRREIKDRRKIVAELRETAKKLAASPDDLVLALTLFDQTEKLADDLYDLSQLAYDNDLEEPATRLTEFLVTVDHDQDLIERYVFNLAEEEQKQLLQLQRENQEIRQKVQEGGQVMLPSPDAGRQLGVSRASKVENTRLRRIFDISATQL